MFESQLLTVDEIVALWTEQLDKLQILFPHLQVVFTISPVRHWKDGAHGNQVSKSLLFIAVDELLKHKAGPKYFPAYELVMDDLRDYRFYNDDMLHPSGIAINYIWEAFTRCYMDSKTINTWNEVVKITKACNHRFNNDSGIKRIKFAERILGKIYEIENKVPGIDISSEKSYFLNLLKRQ